MNSWWKTSLLVLFTAVVVGGGTYWFTNSRATQDKAALQDRIDSLSKKVSALESANSTAPTVTAPKSDGNTATSDPTADWRSYSNSTYGLSFKYPKEWFVFAPTGDTRVYIQSVPGDVDKGIASSGFQRFWIELSATSAKSDQNSVNATIAPYIASTYLSSDSVKSIVYEYYTGDGAKPMANSTTGEKHLTAFFTHGQLFELQTASEVGRSNSQSQADIAKKVIGTIQFTK